MSKRYMHQCKRLLFILCCLPLLLGAAENTSAPFDITGVNKAQLKNIKMRLADLYAHPTQHTISKEILREQVGKALEPYGFFNSRIHLVLPQGKHAGKIHIQLGRPVRITQLTVHINGPGRGNHEIQNARQDLPIALHHVFNSMHYEDAKNKLLNAAEHEGYLNASFDQSTVRIDKIKAEAHISLFFNTGPRSYFGDIKFITTTTRPPPKLKNEINIPHPKLSKIIQFFKPFAEKNPMFTTGHIALSPNLLFGYVPFEYGAPYSNDDIMTFNSNLMNSGYFRTVDVAPTSTSSPETNHHLPLAVHLEPIDRFSYSLSGGYGTDTGARGRVGLHITPLNTYGHTFDAVGQGSSNQNAAQLKYTIPGHDPIHDQYTINGGFTNLNYISGNSRSGNMSLVAQHLKSKFQRVFSLNGLHEQFHYDKQTPTERTVVYPKALLAWREVSDPLFSPSGYNITLNAFAANRAALSSISVGSITLDAKAAFTFGLTRTRVYGHVLQGLTQINDIYTLPLSLALLLGGPENMKGYSFNSIGPGKVLSYGGVELQQETLDSWYLIGFIDKGTVYRPEPKLLQYDVGIGLMWRSPVGPIKAAIAQPVDNRLRRMPDTGFRFVVNMGPDI